LSRAMVTAGMSQAQKSSPASTSSLRDTMQMSPVKSQLRLGGTLIASSYKSPPSPGSTDVPPSPLGSVRPVSSAASSPRGGFDTPAEAASRVSSKSRSSASRQSSGCWRRSSSQPSSLDATGVLMGSREAALDSAQAELRRTFQTTQNGERGNFLVKKIRQRGSRSVLFAVQKMNGKDDTQFDLDTLYETIREQEDNLSPPPTEQSLARTAPAGVLKQPTASQAQALAQERLEALNVVESQSRELQTRVQTLEASLVASSAKQSELRRKSEKLQTRNDQLEDQNRKLRADLHSAYTHRQDNPPGVPFAAPSGCGPAAMQWVPPSSSMYSTGTMFNTAHRQGPQAQPMQPAMFYSTREAQRQAVRSSSVPCSSSRALNGTQGYQTQRRWVVRG